MSDFKTQPYVPSRVASQRIERLVQGLLLLREGQLRGNVRDGQEPGQRVPLQAESYRPLHAAADDAVLLPRNVPAGRGATVCVVLSVRAAVMRVLGENQYFECVRSLEQLRRRRHNSCKHDGGSWLPRHHWHRPAHAYLATVSTTAMTCCWQALRLSVTDCESQPTALLWRPTEEWKGRGKEGGVATSTAALNHLANGGH